eukprot:jgi/Mesvir1/23340/Mv21036-RA.1
MQAYDPWLNASKIPSYEFVSDGTSSAPGASHSLLGGVVGGIVGGVGSAVDGARGLFERLFGAGSGFEKAGDARAQATSAFVEERVKSLEAQLKDLTKEHERAIEALDSAKTDSSAVVASEPYKNLAAIEQESRSKLQDATKSFEELKANQKRAGEVMEQVLQARREIVENMRNPDKLWDDGAMKASLAKLESLINDDNADLIKSLNIEDWKVHAQNDVDNLRLMLDHAKQNTEAVTEAFMALDKSRREKAASVSENAELQRRLAEAGREFEISKADAIREIQEERTRLAKKHEEEKQRLEEDLAAAAKAGADLEEARREAEAEKERMESRLAKIVEDLQRRKLSHEDLQTAYASLQLYLDKIRDVARSVDVAVTEFTDSGADAISRANAAEEAIKEAQRAFGKEDDSLYPIGGAYLESQLIVLKEYKDMAMKRIAAEERREEANRENEILSREIAARLLELEERNKEADLLTQNVAELNRRIEEGETTHQALVEENKQLEKRYLEALESRVPKGDAEDILAQLKATKDALVKSRLNIDTLSAQKQETESALRLERESTKASSQRQRDLQKELKHSQFVREKNAQDTKRVAEQLGAAKKQQKQLEMAKKELETRIKLLQRENKNVAMTKEEQIRLQASISNAREELENHKRESDENIANLEMKLQTYTKERAQLGTITNELDNSKLTIESLTKDNDSLLAQIESLEKRKEKNDKGAVFYKTRLEEAKKAHEKLAGDKEAADARIQDLLHLSEEQRSLSSAEILGLKQELDKIQRAKTAIEADMRSSEASMGELKTRIATLSEDRERDQQTAAQVLKDLTVAKDRDIATLKDELSNATKEMQDIREMMSVVRNGDYTNEDIAKMQRDYNKASYEVASLKSLINSDREYYDKLQKEVKESLSWLDSLYGTL